MVVAGQGREEIPLRESGLELTGMLPRESVRDWIAAADVVAVPSRWESFGIFALEAMATGAAVVATDIPGLRETVGNVGRYVPADDPQALGRAIAALLADPDARSRIGQLAAQRARQFTAESWARATDLTYRSLVTR